MHLSLAKLSLGLGIAVTAGAIGYETLAALRLRNVRQRAQAAVSETPPVTILKPLAGIEEQLYENLSSFVDQQYPQVQVIFGVSNADDPAAAVARQVIARFPDADVSLVVGDRSTAVNPKVANLSSMIRHVKHDVLVIADADMRVDPTYLRAIASAFDDSRVGAVTCLYSGVPVGGTASTLGAMYINEQFAPSVLVANLIEPLTYCFGSTMAVRRTVLDEIGGLAALGGYIGDDYLLGKLVSERGYRVALAPYVVRNVVREPDLGALIAHELRWARTIRAQRPSGYASLFFTQPLLCASALLVASGGSVPAWFAFGGAVIARALVHITARRALEVSGAPVWAIPLRDALTAGVWIGGFFTRGVRWRERTYTIESDGRVATSRSRPASVDRTPP